MFPCATYLEQTPIWKVWRCSVTHVLSVYKILATALIVLNLFEQSWTGERGEGLPEPSVLLGEEVGPLCSCETITSEEWVSS